MNLDIQVASRGVEHEDLARLRLQAAHKIAEELLFVMPAPDANRLDVHVQVAIKTLDNEERSRLHGDPAKVFVAHIRLRDISPAADVVRHCLEHGTLSA